MGILVVALVALAAGAEPAATAKQSPADLVRAAAAEGKLAYKLTEPKELKDLLGTPKKESTRSDGGMQILTLQYPSIKAYFGKMKTEPSPFTLLRLETEKGPVDIGENRKILLRNIADLKKFDSFWGLANTSLINLDLTEQKERLQELPFDSRTDWPPPDKLPKGFDPIRLLEDGKNPGLGIRQLHKQGIDGRGIHIAIIDQPLLKNHVEYASQLIKYESLVEKGVPVQMHGPPVASIAVGKTCGVAPAASLSYYAVPSWKWQGNEPYCKLLNRILDQNASLKPAKRIRVISISLGMFSSWPGFESWKKAVERAARQGVLVVTCDHTFLRYGTAKRVPGEDPDKPTSLRRGKYSSWRDALLVPAGNRTTASHHGPKLYTFWREGGMSWSAPYLAGLAALAFQVYPDIAPQKIVELYTQTAARTKGGTIVNPPGFLEAVRKLRNQSKTSTGNPSSQPEQKLTRPGKISATQPYSDIEKKVAQLEIRKSTLEDVIQIFGEPIKYAMGRKTFSKNDLSDHYIAIYTRGFFVEI